MQHTLPSANLMALCLDNFNAAAETTIGAKLHVALGEVSLLGPLEFPSVASFSLKQPIMPMTCPFGSVLLTGTEGRRLLSTINGLGNWAQIGNVWHGEQVYTGKQRRAPCNRLHMLCSCIVMPHSATCLYMQASSRIATASSVAALCNALQHALIKPSSHIFVHNHVQWHTCLTARRPRHVARLVLCTHAAHNSHECTAEY